MTTPTEDEIARAFEIADQAMLERIESEGAIGDVLADAYGLTDEDGREVSCLAEARASLQEAVEWLEPRGYVVMIPEPDGESESIHIVRRPDDADGFQPY